MEQNLREIGFNANLIQFAITTLGRINITILDIYDIALRVALLTNTQAPDDITLAKNQLFIDIYNTLLADNHLSMEPKARIGNTIRHLVGNRRLQFEQQLLQQAQRPSFIQPQPLLSIPERQLPPGWVATTNEFGRPIFRNQVNGEIRFAFPEAASIAAAQAQAPSAPPPLDPVLIDRVKTNYYPNISEFSRIPALEIIEMLYSPEMPPHLTQDDVELIINNYVGTNISRVRKGDSFTVSVPYETDILECAKIYFKNNAFTAKNHYSYQSPTVRQLPNCTVPFKWHPHNERERPLMYNPVRTMSSRLFPQNTNTVRWLMSTQINPIPSLAEGQQYMFVLDYYDAKTDYDLRTDVIKIDEVRKRMEYMTSEAYRVQQALEAKQKEEHERKERIASIERARQEGILASQRENQRKKDQEQRDKETRENMSRFFGGFKSNRKQSNRKQSNRKQSNRKQKINKNINALQRLK
jgi:hypothetical protein